MPIAWAERPRDRWPRPPGVASNSHPLTNHNMPTAPAPIVHLFHPHLIIDLSIPSCIAAAHITRLHAMITYRGTEAYSRMRRGGYATRDAPCDRLGFRLRPLGGRSPGAPFGARYYIFTISLKPYVNTMQTGKSRGGRPLSVTPWQRLLIIAQYLTSEASATEIGQEIRARQGGRLRGSTVHGYVAWWRAQHPDDPVDAIRKAIGEAFHDEVAARDASDARRGKQQRKDRPSNADIVTGQVRAVLGARWSPPPPELRHIVIPERVGTRGRR